MFYSQQLHEHFLPAFTYFFAKLQVHHKKSRSKLQCSYSVAFGLFPNCFLKGNTADQLILMVIIGQSTNRHTFEAFDYVFGPEINFNNISKRSHNQLVRKHLPNRYVDMIFLRIFAFFLGEWIVLLNNRIEVEPKCIIALVCVVPFERFQTF